MAGILAAPPHLRHLAGMNPQNRNTADVILAAIDRSGGQHSCWPWTRGRNRSGYGTAMFNGRREMAHRLSWTLHRGPIPDGLRVLHRCDNPPCCNPAHLFLGTMKDNTLDMISKGRNSRGPRHAVAQEKSRTRGERVPQSRLTEADVVEARRLYSTGEWSYTALAARYGVSWSGIGMAISGRTWRHVAEPTGKLPASVGKYNGRRAVRRA